MSTPVPRIAPFDASHPDGERTLPVSEHFGPTIQGEGRHSGLAVQFLRLGGCNLACSWCDTPYTWDASRYNLREELTPTAVRDLVAASVPGLPLVLSGGEPLMHQNNPAFAYLLQGLTDAGIEVHVETNGTIAPNQSTRLWVRHYTLSPKLAHAGEHKAGQSPRLDPEWLTSPAKSLADMKFVVRDAGDVVRVAAMVDDWGWPRDQTFVMPLGTSADELQSRWGEVARAAATLRINACHRTHVLAWGDIKGT